MDGVPAAASGISAEAAFATSVWHGWLPSQVATRKLPAVVSYNGWTGRTGWAKRSNEMPRVPKKTAARRAVNMRRTTCERGETDQTQVEESQPPRHRKEGAARLDASAL